MRTGILISLFLLLLGLLPGNASGQEHTGRQMLLVASTAFPGESVSSDQLRQSYLAVTVTVDGVRLRPQMNESDDRLTEVFLQKIMFMTHERYDRQVVSRIFRQGGQRPPAFDKVGELADALRANPAAVSFMWAEQLEAQDGLKSLAILWQEANL